MTFKQKHELEICYHIYSSLVDLIYLYITTALMQHKLLAIDKYMQSAGYAHTCFLTGYIQ